MLKFAERCKQIYSNRSNMPTRLQNPQVLDRYALARFEDMDLPSFSNPSISRARILFVTLITELRP